MTVAPAGPPTAASAAGASGAAGIAAAVSATALAAATLVILAVAVERPVPAGQRLAVAVTAAVMVAGIWAVHARHPAAAVGMAVAVAGSLLPLWTRWAALPAATRQSVLAAAPLAIAGVAQVALSWSPAAPPARYRLLVPSVLAAAAAAVVLTAYNPFADPGCTLTCADMRPVLGDLLSTRAAVTVAGTSSAAAALAAGVFLLADWSASAAAARLRLPAPPRLLVAAALVALALLAWSWAARVVWWTDPYPLAVAAPGRIEPWAVASVGLVLCLIAVQTSRRRAVIGRLITSLAASGPAVGGPAVNDLHVAIPGSPAHWVDIDGQPVPTECPDAVVLSHRAEPVLRLIPAYGIDATELLAAATPSTMLALRNTQLAVLGRVRHDDVRASQRRIVAASDAERRRIERDLHDGAQQRLVSIALHLRVAMARADPDLATTLAAAEAHIRNGLAHLRRLAHGVFPTVLGEEGLTAALEELVANCPLPDVTLWADVPHEPPPAATMAAYTTASAALTALERAPADGSILIEVLRDNTDLVLRAETTGPPLTLDPDLIDAADRVGAAGGRLDLIRTGPKTVLTAVIPCGS